jgi:hypothetical protein
MEEGLCRCPVKKDVGDMHFSNLFGSKSRDLPAHRSRRDTAGRVKWIGISVDVSERRAHQWKRAVLFRRMVMGIEEGAE